MISLGAVFGLVTGCSSVASDGAGGEAGAGSDTPSSTVGKSGSTSAKTTAASGMMYASSTYGNPFSGCDDGQLGALSSQICNDCQTCAFNDECFTELADFQADPDWTSYLSCIDCPADDPETPADETQVCLDGCVAAYPTAAALHAELFACSVCTECTNNCDAATNCL